MQFKLLSRSEIDSAKWNLCIENSDYPHAYGTSWYLDIVCPNGWEALVWGDYQAVMPLPIGKILRFRQTFTPFWIQQLGLFQKKDCIIDTLKLHQFLTKRFRFFDLCVHSMDCFQNVLLFHERCNFEWTFSKSNHREAYSKNLKRHLKKAKEKGLRIAKGKNSAELIRFFREYKGGQIQSYNQEDYNRLGQLIDHNLQHDEGVVLKVLDGDKVVAMAFYQIVFRRATYLLGTSNSEGRNCGAMQFMMDHFVEQWKEKIDLLDCEGSALPGLQQFYKSFGAEEKTYFRLRYNKLPIPLKWIKNKS